MDREKLLKGLGNGFSESALVILLEDLAPMFSLVDQDLNRLVTPDLGVGQLKRQALADEVIISVETRNG